MTHRHPLHQLLLLAAAIVLWAIPIHAQSPHDELPPELLEAYGDGEGGLDPSRLPDDLSASPLSSETQEALRGALTGLEDEIPEHIREQLFDEDGEAAPDVEDAAARALPTGEASSAVTPSRISLPSAEGSVEGMGESFTPSLSSGTGTFGVPITLPAGRNGVQPSLGLSYSTGGGNSPVGFGWGMSAPVIVRQSDRGLPRYRDVAQWTPEEDRFFYNGGQELVPVDNAQMALVDASGGLYAGTGALPDGVGSDWQQYRARIEGGFMRFFRAPDFGRWVVQGKDGTRFDFGLLPVGTHPPELDPSTSLQREGSDGAVYAWHLTRMSDAHGSAVYYRYASDGGQTYLTDLFYLSPNSCAPSGGSDLAAAAQGARQCTASLSDYGVRVRIVYEDRPDAFTQYTSGWAIETAWRVRRIEVTAAENTVGERFLVRRYHLSYRPEAESFHSLLQSVQIEGRPDGEVTGLMPHRFYNAAAHHVPEDALDDTIVGRTLPPMTFGYTQTPAGTIAGFGGVSNVTSTVGVSPNVSFDADRADLFDVNTDGLPDLVVAEPGRFTTADGQPAVGVYFNGFTGPDASPAGQTATFSDMVPVPMPPHLAGSLRFDNPNIRPMDVDGDGRNDWLHMPRLDHYGFFTPTRNSDADAGHSVSPADQDWAFTYAEVELDPGDLDPRIDFVHGGASYRVFDVNGDHLVDVVRTSGTRMQTWLNLGWVPGAGANTGRFGQAHWNATAGAWDISTSPYETCLLIDGGVVDFSDPQLRLADMNGDGLQDIVKIRAGRVVYWPGRGVTPDGSPVFGEGPAQCLPGQGAGRQIEMDAPPLGLEMSRTYLSDVNADGAADVVQVRFGHLDVWFNRAGQGFTEELTVTTPSVPDFAGRVRFADIDGSATVDLVYGRAGNWEYVDLLGGQRPRLLTTVDNGLGGTTAMAYASAAEDYVQDLLTADNGGDGTGARFTWSHVGDDCDQLLMELSGECVHRSGGTPVLSTVVRSMETRDNIGGIAGREGNVVQTLYAYHDGYYEGIEQEFRGFGAADTVAVGDTVEGPGYTPSGWSRSHFHQGRRPSAIATDRLAENPYEALKGRLWMAESFNDHNVFLSTALSTSTLRKLATGLDGREIWYAYVSETNTLRYGTHEFGASPGNLAFPAFVEQEVGPGGGIPSGGEVTWSSVPIRGADFARVRGTTEHVDNLGHVLQQSAHGQVTAAETPVAIDEVHTSHTTPALISGARWIWRTESSHLTGSADPATHLGENTSTFNALGDPLSTAGTARLPTARQGGGALSAHFTFPGDAHGAQALDPAVAYPGGAQVMQASTTYDAWGNATSVCGGSVTGTGCRRYAAMTYGDAYAQLPIVEATAIGATGTTDPAVPCSGIGDPAYCTLATLALWDRGLGAIVESTDPNIAKSKVRYDGFGRTTASIVPSVGSDCADNVQTVINYELNVEGHPLSRVHTQTLAHCNGNLVDNAYAFTDGLGRPRATLLRTEHPGKLQRSGVAFFNARGESTRAHNNDYVESAAVPTVAQALSAPTTPFATAHHDAFGRVVESVERDGDISAVRYGALWTQTFDPLDLQSGHVAHMTPETSYVDGHGRGVAHVLINRTVPVPAPGHTGVFDPASTTEFYRLSTQYRADGAVLSVTRAQLDLATDSTGLIPVGRTASPMAGRSLTRHFTYDTAGRRLTTIDHDSQSAAGQNWRYLYNDLGELAGVRDARGCGQNFYYDFAGRLLGEDYVQCAEAQDTGDIPDVSVPAGSTGLSVLAAPQAVDVRHSFDVLPAWVASSGETVPSGDALLGRMTGTSDRGQRSAVLTDLRGRAVWTARQMAMVPQRLGVGATLSGDVPLLDTADQVTSGNLRAYDAEHTYVATTTYDRIDRPVRVRMPDDPDYDDGTGAAAPVVEGEMGYNARGLPRWARARIGGAAHDLWYQTYGENALPRSTRIGTITWAGESATHITLYDGRLRPVRQRMTVSRPAAVPGSPDLAGRTLESVRWPFDYRYAWDAANNLYRVQNNSPQGDWPDEQRPDHRVISHDALYRVRQVDYSYVKDTGWDHHGWVPDDADPYTDWRQPYADHQSADPMERQPAPRVPAAPSERPRRISYRYDWLANMTQWTDDAGAFYERSLGDGQAGAMVNGMDDASAGRPSALYLASSIGPAGAFDASVDRGGWVHLSYGESGNVQTMTVRGQCHDVAGVAGASDRVCGDNRGLGPDARNAHLAAHCQCAVEQHYQYRWDELSRIAEARRYDRGGVAGAHAAHWHLQVQQRYLYDAGNQRTVKVVHVDGRDEERAALYVFPGDYERRGVVPTHSGAPDGMGGTFSVDAYSGDAAHGAEPESQYLIAGARIVWKGAPSAAGSFDADARISYVGKDLLGNSAAVVDLQSGELLEVSTFLPSGVRETYRTRSATGGSGFEAFSLEPNGFTGKEGDDEVGLMYFGHRYLMPHLGRWASPDPLEIHQPGEGGEFGNAFHYVGGNLLQATDPTGLEAEWLPSIDREDYPNDELWQGRLTLYNAIVRLQSMGVPTQWLEVPGPWFGIVPSERETAYCDFVYGYVALTQMSVEVGGVGEWMAERTFYEEIFHAYSLGFSEINQRMREMGRSDFEDMLLENEEVTSDPDRLFDEAIAGYVAHRVSTFSQIVGYLERMQVDGILTPESFGAFVRIYNDVMQQDTFGYQYDASGEEQIPAGEPMPSRLREFLDHEVLGGAVPTRFEDSDLLMSYAPDGWEAEQAGE